MRFKLGEDRARACTQSANPIFVRCRGESNTLGARFEKGRHVLQSNPGSKMAGENCPTSATSLLLESRWGELDYSIGKTRFDWNDIECGAGGHWNSDITAIIRRPHKRSREIARFWCKAPLIMQDRLRFGGHGTWGAWAMMHRGLETWGTWSIIRA